MRANLQMRNNYYKSPLSQILNNFFKLVIGVFLFVIIFSNQSFSNPNNKLYEKLDIFSDVLETLKKEYVDDVDQAEIIDSAINGMLQSLDPYSAYMSPDSFKNMNADTKGEFGGLGIEITMEAGLVKVITPIEGTPADKAGIQAGDYIVKINDKQVKGMTLLDSVKLMRGKVGTKINLTIRRVDVDDELKFTITRAIIKIREVSAEVKNNVGYLRLRAFNEKSHNQLTKKIIEISNKNLNGYILDLRNNPGGLLSQAIKITETFLDGGEVVSTKGRDKNDIKIYNAKKGDLINKKPLIVLINKGSASASEIVSGALKDHKRAILLGEKSFGKGSVQSIIPLKNKGGLRLTTAKYYLPSGESIHEKGVEPDITVKASKDDFKINTKTDNQLEYAINLLKKS
jgi:carboxyl-terminal processing protease